MTPAQDPVGPKCKLCGETIDRFGRDGWYGIAGIWEPGQKYFNFHNTKERDCYTKWTVHGIRSL